jgi:hypothetical protein
VPKGELKVGFVNFICTLCYKVEGQVLIPIHFICRKFVPTKNIDLNAAQRRVELFRLLGLTGVHGVRKLGLHQARTDLRHPDVVRTQASNLKG